MAALITNYDRSIIDSNSLRIVLRRPTNETGTTTERRDVAFQFPPKIPNDSRAGDWKEDAAGPNSGDKIAVYKAASPRRITVEWKYIVGYANWSIDKIKDQLKLLRGYFRNPFIENAGETALSPLVVELRLWEVGGRSTMSFRLDQVNIKHGPTLVGKKPDLVFPLLTDVSADFKSWPKIGNPPAQTVPGQLPFGLEWF